MIWAGKLEIPPPDIRISDFPALGPKPVFRRADIRRISGGYPPSGGVLRMDFP